MARRSEFVDHLLDLLVPLGEVTAKGMFGGWGIYSGGRMFALVAYDTFYVKVDDTTRERFKQAGLSPFHYETKSGRRETISYYTVPSDALESSDSLCEWSTLGIEAANRAAQAKPAAKSSKTQKFNS